jgi:hypothetical protein
LQLFVFILFLTGSALPHISLTNGHWHVLYTYVYYNLGDAFERLTNIPHHLFSEACTMIIFIIAFNWWRKYTRAWRTVICIALLGFIISSIQALWWFEITVVLGIIGFIAPKNRKVHSLLPAITMGVSGLPFVMYLRFYSYFPTNQATFWPIGSAGSAEQVATTLWEYILRNGPLVITGILGLPFWFRHMSREKFALTFMAVFSLLLFFSPFPKILNIANFRFLNVFPTLFFAATTGFLLWKLHTLYPKLKPLFVLSAAIIIGLSIPSNIQQLSFRNNILEPNNGWVYIPADAIHAYEEAEKISRTNDIFIVPYPFDASFVGLIGRRLFVSASYPYPYNLEAKNTKVDAFFNTSVHDEDKKSFLKQSRIAYIMYWSVADAPYSGLIPVYRNNLMTLYKVPAL